MECDADLPDGDRRGAGCQLYRERQSGRSGQLAQRRIQRQLGLGAIHADEAYAAGYTGKGQKVGIFDTPVNRHPEFAGDGKLINVVTEGYRAYTDPHRPGINAGDRFYFDGTFHFYSGSQGMLSNHGCMSRASAPPTAMASACMAWPSIRR